MGKCRKLKHVDLRLNPPLLTPPQFIVDESPPSQLFIGFIDPFLLLHYLELCHGEGDDEDDGEDDGKDEMVKGARRDSESGESDDGTGGQMGVNQAAGKNQDGEVDAGHEHRDKDRTWRGNWHIHKVCSFVFLGDPCTGKSGCLHHLRNPGSTCKRMEYIATRGVEVGEWVPFGWLKPQDDNYLKMVMFDCSGQPACRGVVGLALPQNAVYILVWTPSIPPGADGIPAQEERIDDKLIVPYLREMTHEWLNLIQARAPGADVLLVCERVRVRARMCLCASDA